MNRPRLALDRVVENDAPSASLSPTIVGPKSRGCVTVRVGHGRDDQTD